MNIIIENSTNLLRSLQHLFIFNYHFDNYYQAFGYLDFGNDNTISHGSTVHALKKQIASCRESCASHFDLFENILNNCFTSSLTYCYDSNTSRRMSVHSRHTNVKNLV